MSAAGFLMTACDAAVAGLLNAGIADAGVKSRELQILISRSLRSVTKRANAWITATNVNRNDVASANTFILFVRSFVVSY